MTGHVWVPDADEGMIVCHNCDCYRGSKASMRPCSAQEEAE